MYQSNVVEHITNEFVDDLNPSFEIDFLVGKSLGLFSHFVALSKHDFMDLDPSIITTFIKNKIERAGEYFICTETHFVIETSSWNPSTDATQIAYLIDEYKPAINFVNIADNKCVCVVILYPHLVSPTIVTPNNTCDVYTATGDNFIIAFCRAIIKFHHNLGENYE